MERKLKSKVTFISYLKEMKQSSSKFQKLPLYILLQIRGESLKVCFNLIFSLPRLGIYSLTHQVEIQRSFLIKIESYLDTQYTLNGKLHNPDGPALKFDDGSKLWYKHGKHHRPEGEGPAIEWDDGSLSWYEDGNFIRGCPGQIESPPYSDDEE
jgi:hypothetical protein